MKYVALLTIINPELNQEVRPSHLTYVSELYQAGKVHMAGPFADGRGGLVIYNCDTEQEATQLATADPVVQSGARTVEVRAWSPLHLPLA